MVIIQHKQAGDKKKMVCRMRHSLSHLEPSNEISLAISNFR